MPANMDELAVCLSEMRKIYFANPLAAVRSSEFIYPLHDYCAKELISATGTPDKIQVIEKDKVNGNKSKKVKRAVIDQSKLQLIKEATIAGSHKNKKVDIALTSYTNGPQIIIGVRSQMSSVHKNILTYYEEIIGDCISLHDRFPMAVIGYVYLLPTAPIKSGLEKEKIDLEKAEKLFELISNRLDWRDAKDKYEHFAFLKVDFNSTPPSLLPTSDMLNISTFFDKLLITHEERNYFNRI